MQKTKGRANPKVASEILTGSLAMKSRERVVAALNFNRPDRLPKDLGGMRSTGIRPSRIQNLLRHWGCLLKGLKFTMSGNACSSGYRRA